MRIAVIGLRGYPSSYGGIERGAEELYPALVRYGHEITIFSREAASSQRFEGITVVPTPALSAPFLSTITHAAVCMLRYVTPQRFDVVHLHALAPALFLYTCRTPSVVTVHGLDSRRKRWRGFGAAALRLAERQAVYRASEMITVSEELRSYFEAVYSRRTVYIPNAISRPAQRRPGTPPSLHRKVWGKGYVLCVSRLVPEKRVEDVIRAVPLDITLVIVGDGPTGYVQQLRRLAVGRPLVIFAGHQERSEVRWWLEHATLFASASELEGLPLAVVEAMAHGLPTVLSDIAPHRELATAAPGAVLRFPVGDIPSLNKQLLTVLHGGMSYRTQVMQIYEKAESLFDVASMTAHTEAVLQAALGHDRRHEKETTRRRRM